MYPDLSYFFHDLLGSPRDNWLSIFKTFGFFLLLAFLVAARLLKWELQRREKIGQLQPTKTTATPGRVTPADIGLNALFGFVLGYKLPFAFANLERFKRNAGDVLLTTEGWWWSGLLGAVLMGGYYYFQSTKQRDTEPREFDVYPSDRIGPITMAAAVGGIVGSKVFAIIEYLPQLFVDPIGTLFSGSGFAIYGGLIGGAVAVFYYLHRNGISFLPVADAVAPALIFAYGVGRMGCQFSGDGDWGVAAGPQPGWWFLPDWLWSYRFPHNVNNDGIAIPGCEAEYCSQLAVGVFPTSVYEIVMAFAIGGILWAFRKRLTALPGVLFSGYLFFNGVERFCIEFFRVNPRYDWAFGLSQAQMIAIGFMLAGIASGYYFVRRARTVSAEGPRTRDAVEE